MQPLTFTEENYLKAIYYRQQQNAAREVSVNEIAGQMATRPATVTDMMRKLSEKKLVHYEKYKKITLTTTGTEEALSVIRKHRLWEVFLHDKLHFSWDEVHEIAEELEHIRSPKLIERLDTFLGFPRFDPHGDPIPDAFGEIRPASDTTLSESKIGTPLQLVAVKDTSTEFLQHLERFDIRIGTRIEIEEQLPFDQSVVVRIEGNAPVTLSEKIAKKLLVVSPGKGSPPPDHA